MSVIHVLLLSSAFYFCIHADAPEPKSIQPDANLILLDGIKAIIIHENTDIILHSDVQRPSINGAVQTIEDLILEALIFHDAQRFAMVPSDEEVDSYLKTLQRENNLSLEQLEQIFQQGGYTLEEGKEQLKRLQAVQAITHARAIGQNFLIPEKEIEAYYHAHPEFVDASYTIQRILIPFQENKKEQEKNLHKKQGISDASWSSSFTIQESDLAEDKKFIMQMQPGTISAPLETVDGFELFKLIGKQKRRKKSLAEQKELIISTLQKPYFEQALKKYYEKLRAEATVLSF